jgi:hypothetical protein
MIALKPFLRLLLLDGGQVECCANTSFEGVPDQVVALGVPGQCADPRLDIVMQPELDVFNLSDLSGGVGDLVFRLLVLELEKAPTTYCQFCALAQCVPG